MKAKFASLMSMLSVMLISSCGGKLPQAELTYTTDLSAKDRAAILKRGDLAPKSAREKIEREQRLALRKELGFTEMKTEVDATLVDVGFFPNRSDGYAIYGDGSAFYVRPNGELQALDTLVERIDQVILAGPNLRRVVGVSANGTQASWNTQNLTQQLVIRPQKSTFGRVHVFDTSRVNGSPYIVTASEGGLLEMWSLTSGSLVRRFHLKGDQPRRIAHGSTKNRVIFGTNKGAVRIWKGSRTSTLLYSHSGPLLDIYYLPKHGFIVSASKDGTVKVFDMKTRALIKTMQFKKAVYQINIAPDESRIVVVPSIGVPLIVDLSTMKERKMRPTIHNITSTVYFAANTKYMIAQHGAKGLSMWNLAVAVQRGDFQPKHCEAVTSFRIAKPSNMIIVQIGENRVEYWNIGNKMFAGTALISQTTIAQINVSTDGKWLLVGLVDGRLLRQKIVANQKYPIKVQ